MAFYGSSIVLNTLTYTRAHTLTSRFSWRNQATEKFNNAYKAILKIKQKPKYLAILFLYIFQVIFTYCDIWT